jgi:hypothetical protein
MTCDDVLEALVAGEPLPAAVSAHVAGCPRCTADRAHALAIARALADPVPAVPPTLRGRTLVAAAPLLARNARRATWPLAMRALAVAALPLPVVLLLDLRAVRALYDALATVLPDAVSLWVVSSWAATLTVLLALTYAAIPILAERQSGALLRSRHA